MSVLSLSLSHHHAPLDLRGRFAFAPEQLPVALRSLRERLGRAQPEVTLLSTCNRTELYVAPASGVASGELVRPALDWLAEQGGASGSTLLQHTRVAEQVDAARHAFRVAAGLDSMVLGEPQILGQIKLAVREAGQAGTMGSTLHQLFQRAFSVAKEVRTATDIGAHSVSMSAAAVRLAQQLFGDLSEVRVLFVGAGEMIELAAAHFAGRKPKSMTVANRSAQRGEALARRFGCEAIGLADLPHRLHQFDVVVSCTASTLPIIGLGAMESAPAARCSWWTWRCRATSSPRSRACRTSICTPWTICRCWCRPVARSARPRWRRPRRSSTPACAALRTGWISATTCR
jgi:glutamyl-tRNA reductase